MLADGAVSSPAFFDDDGDPRAAMRGVVAIAPTTAVMAASDDNPSLLFFCDCAGVPAVFGRLQLQLLNCFSVQWY